MVDLQLLLVAAVLLALTALSFLTWRSVARAPAAGASAENLRLEVARLQERDKNLADEKKQLVAKAQELASELHTLRNNFTKSREEVAAAQNEHQSLRDAIAQRNEKIAGLEKVVEEFRGKAEASLRQLAELRANHANLQQDLEEKKKELLNLQAKLTTEFENIATRVLKASSTELSETSQKEIAAVLDPLRERIREFESKIENTYEAEKRDVLALKEQIKHVVDTSQHLGSQADGLAKALKGDIQMLGRWGELVLERVLSAAGLQEGRDYITQGRNLRLKNDAGGAQKPDVILKLPEDRVMVIDSKVSLASYDRLITAKSESERVEHAKQFVQDVKAHIDDLASKRYQDNEQIAAHDCVLMFVPIEGALAAALSADPELFAYAWDKRVVLVGPPTLLMTARTVASIWRYERQTRNAKAIAAAAGRLYDKLVGVAEDFNDVSKRLRDALTAHNSALSKLVTGRGNALGRAQKLKALGADTKKNLPLIDIDGEKLSADDDEDGEDAQMIAAE
jgi:DNA recombination protein RmuC